MQKHNRRSIRLKDYDYSSCGDYFVTIVTHYRELLLGRINNGQVILSQVGNLVREIWLGIPIHFPNTELGAFVIMPNHIHGIISIIEDPGRGTAQGAREGMLCPYHRGKPFCRGVWENG